MSQHPAPGRNPFSFPDLPGAYRRLSAGARILLLALIALIPVFAFISFFIYQGRVIQNEQAVTNVTNLADATALTTVSVVEVAQSTALALSGAPVFITQEVSGATQVLQTTLAQHATFVNLWAADAEGRVYASAQPLPAGPPPSVAGESYFQGVLASGGPVLSTGQGIPGSPGVFVAITAVPVRENGRISGVLQIAFELTALHTAGEFIGLPSNSTFTVLDGQGTIIERSVNPERWRGLNISETVFWQGVSQGAEGSWAGPGLDGVPRLHGYQTVPGTDWRAVVGLPLIAVYGPIDLNTIAELGLLVLLGIIAGLTTWRGKQLADLVEDEQRRVRGIIDQMPEGVLVANPRGRVLVANEALGELLGLRISADADYRRQIEPVAWFDDGRPIASDLLPAERALRGEIIQGAQVTIRRPDSQQRDLLINARPLRGADGAIQEVVVVTADITPLKDLDRAKDEFISIAAHELRNPLAGLKGFAEILLRGADREGFSDETRRRLDTIKRLADSLDELIGSLLEVSRFDIGRFELARRPADLVALAREVRDAQQAATSDHRLTVEAHPDQITGDWDPARLREVLNNLVGNAIKYAPSGEVAIRLAQEDGQVDISISDQGPGIPPENQAHLFERFRQAGTTAAQRAGGLGLGLYLARRIVEAHNGRIGVESRVGEGSTFWFTLPLRPEQPSHEPSPAVLAHAQPG